MYSLLTAMKRAVRQKIQTGKTVRGKIHAQREGVAAEQGYLKISGQKMTHKFLPGNRLGEMLPFGPPFFRRERVTDMR